MIFCNSEVSDDDKCMMIIAIVDIFVCVCMRVCVCVCVCVCVFHTGALFLHPHVIQFTQGRRDVFAFAA